MKKLISILISLFILFIFTINVSYSQYYADIEIFVDDKGETTIEGVSNYELLQYLDKSSNFTSKKGEIWTLNITINETFDNYIYTLNLPKYSEINYIKTTPTFRISDNDNRIQLIGTGEDRKLIIIVQYKINSFDSFFDGKKSLFFFIFLFLILSITLRLMGYKLRKQKFDQSTNKDTNITNNNNNNNKSKLDNKININYNKLSERQINIINLLKKNRRMTQKELEKKLKIPKSSISRNINSLISKNYIIKESKGQSNHISLNDKFNY